MIWAIRMRYLSSVDNKWHSHTTRWYPSSGDAWEEAELFQRSHKDILECASSLAHREPRPSLQTVHHKKVVVPATGGKMKEIKDNTIVVQAPCKINNNNKPYWAVSADGFPPRYFHYLKNAQECYNWCLKNHYSAPELYRVNQKPTGTGKWIRL